MIDTERLIDIAKAAGFDAAGEMDCSTIELKSEVRAACEINKCGCYGTNWSCPPGCGTLKECTQQVRKYSEGLIVQTIGELEDEFDGEGMEAAMRRHEQSFRRLAKQLRNEFPNLLPMGTGGCSLCDSCTYPDAPCRVPEGPTVPMEAFGMLVSDICSGNNMSYYHGKGTITYVGCFLLN